ncbi:unnamed protein product [Dovyalis caffra]|uniref:Fe2OG dioxygenase domain-containing protein n=1 Tax=Dovyalis caffra TaxID=77055 RepID=A0AAV1QU26_9ROSI|nr:unnamed protein product [Dovyalis caffra]CAK7324042.1 unnamed protein product [Dovyalis caffra]
MAKSLNLEENCLSDKFIDGARMRARFNFYPRCSRPDLVLGAKPHTDRSGITVLLQDREVEGLQVFINDKWFTVPIVPDALVVNLGDQMQIMTNGIFKSPLHRVVTNSEKLRISVALFNEPDPEKEIGPMDSLVDEQRPRLYRNIKNYGVINFECYQKGKIALDTMASLFKSVQEMSIDGDEPPPKYFAKECCYAPTEMSSVSTTIPVFDVSLFTSTSLIASKREVEDALEDLRSTLGSAGFFQVIGHGMSGAFLDKVREIAHLFYSLPGEEKQRYTRPVNEEEGYGIDRIVSETQVLNWSHRLVLQVFPEDKRRMNLWPDDPSDFREILHEYAMKVKSLMELLYKAMARSLNIAENSFSDQFGDGALTRARLNFYPRCSRPDLVLGLKPHTDRSGITVLLQDKEVEGLQVLINDKWARVPIAADALVVNLGDQMQIMSNGIFKSPLHRAVTNSERLRISVALFNEPDPEKEIGPVDGLVDAQRPRVYRNVKNYAPIYYEWHQKGKADNIEGAVIV